MSSRNSAYERDELLGKLDLEKGEGNNNGYRNSKSPGGGSRSKWGETDETKTLDNRQFLDMRDQKMREQDALLDTIGETVGRQKKIAQDIGQQVDEQIILIDELHTDVKKVQNRVQRATYQVQKVTEKSSTGCLWIVCLIVFVAFVATVFCAFYF